LWLLLRFAYLRYKPLVSFCFGLQPRAFVFFFFLLKEKRNKKVQGRHESSAIRPCLASPDVAACFFTFYQVA